LPVQVCMPIDSQSSSYPKSLRFSPPRSLATSWARTSNVETACSFQISVNTLPNLALTPTLRSKSQNLTLTRIWNLIPFRKCSWLPRLDNLSNTTISRIFS
jgi:hypothetical protein